LMVYDYYVSDINDGGKLTAPNQPLYGIASKPEFSVSATVGAYLSGGAAPSQIRMGLAFYGHSWVVGQSFKGTSFAKYELEGHLDNGCCGPFQKTYGAKYGPVVQLCGTLGYSEIVDVFHDDYVYVEDNATATTIGYNSKEGVWVSFNSQQAMFGLIDYAKSMNLAGIFMFDISMDLKTGHDEWSFPLTTSMCHYAGTPNCAPIDGCLNDCSKKGKCSSVGQCKCDAGYFGDDCSFFECSADFDCGHGFCSQGACECNDGWFGSDCSKQQSTGGCADPKFYGFSCKDSVNFQQCAAGSAVAQFSCGSNTQCQCGKSIGSPCGTGSSPAKCL